jgi:hypothetical protein
MLVEGCDMREWRLLLVVFGYSIFCIATFSRSAAAAETQILFPKMSEAGAIAAPHAHLDATADRLRVATSPSDKWPGITINAPGGNWDLSKFGAIAADVKNAGTTPVTVYMRIDNVGADGINYCITRDVNVEAGQSGTVRAALGRGDIVLRGMRGMPVGAFAGIDSAHIIGVVFFLNRPNADHVFEIRNLRAETGERLPDPFFPFIDTYGQYIHRDWPGKTHSLDEMKQRREDEAKHLAANPGPANWDQYGGWKDGPMLKSTGFFRTEKYQGKWWLVDPDGRLFFSQGIDCVLEQNATPIDERTTWFQDFPGERPEFRQFVAHHFALKDYYAGKDPNCFVFYSANLLRKYGGDWRNVTAELAQTRLRSWGLNTIGNWSDPVVYRLRKTPYVVTLGSYGHDTRMIEGSGGYWGKFPDPFAATFKENLASRTDRQTREAVNDPWCLGYFVDNEMSWGDELSLGLAALKSPPDQPAKQAMVGDLKQKYGTVDKLNDAWGTQHASWEALLQSQEEPDKDRARADVAAFTESIADQYFEMVKAVLAQRAPHQLYLGCRFASHNPRAVRAAARHCDVISFNIYHDSVDSFALPEGIDRPTLIGEFHFGALDRGMFHPGLVPTANQQQRAKAYTDYVHSVLRHPDFVGCHWFEYTDEPTVGRSFDGENYQIGFVDVVDTPYPETIAAARKLGAEMYGYRAGK